MTVTYSSQVATSSFSCFLKLLLRWRGSIYKLVWKDFAAFAVIYYMFSFTYHIILGERGKRYFESVAVYCETFNNLIPVAFILGFYVSLVVTRFWEQLQSIPWPHRLAVFVSTLVHGIDDRGRLMRRTIVRYLSLSYVLTMRAICSPVRKRFPTMHHITAAGIMLHNEQTILEGMSGDGQTNVYFVPLVWAASLVNRARKEGRVKDDFAVKTLIDEINDYRGKCGSLFCYDWVNVPLVYTQVVTLAVYMFFLSCLMGRQFLHNGHQGDMYFPMFTFLQFFFYMGWLKVAESLLNPFGEDDDDFDINGLVDSNLKTGYVIVDEMYEKLPELVEDKYWDTIEINMPYTKAAEPYRTEVYQGSAVNVPVTTGKPQLIAESFIPASIREETVPRPSGHHDIDGGRKPLMNRHRKQPSSRVGSLHSLRNFFVRSASRTSQPPESDVESGTSSPVRIKMTSRSRDKFPLSVRSVQEETQFHMSDDEEEDVDNLSPVLSIIDENTPSPLPFSQSPPLNAPRKGVLSRSLHHEVDCPQPAASSLSTSMRPAFVEQVREQLREIRETSGSLPKGELSQ